MKVTEQQAVVLAEISRLNSQIAAQSMQLTKLRGEQRALINRLPRALWTFVRQFGLGMLDTDASPEAAIALGKVLPASSDMPSTVTTPQKNTLKKRRIKEGYANPFDADDGDWLFCFIPDAEGPVKMPPLDAKRSASTVPGAFLCDKDGNPIE